MKQEVAVITGASSGIGATLAKMLGAEGHQLVLAARREVELKEVASQSGETAVPVIADVTRQGDVERVKEVALERFGRIDTWINNAGRGIVRPVLELSDDDVDEMINVNLKSALYGMQVVVPYFQQEGRGHLINISSFLGRVPLVTFRSAYSAAKAALNVLTANLRVDLSEHYPDIHVSLIMPAMVLTEFAANALGASPQPPGHRPHPARAQTAEEVARAIMSVMKNPQIEIFTNPASADIARRYYEDIAASEKQARQG